MIGFTGPVTVMVVPLPEALGVMDPEIDNAAVVKLTVARSATAGEVARLSAASAELTRKKYVVFGSRPLSVIACAATSAGVARVLRQG